MNSRSNLFRGLVLLIVLTGIQHVGLSQNCRELSATYNAYESRCTATGSLQVNAFGGSGTYNYKMLGPSTVDYTSSNVITGLQPGTYTLTIRDINTKCTVDIKNIVIPGTYVEPRFGLTEMDVTCNNGTDGSIAVTGLQNGRKPFVFKLVAPSPQGVGTTNNTGSFSGLKAGTYSVQMTDSCGGIQTRTVSIQNYTWSITSSSVTLSSCQSYNGSIGLTDSKGNTNGSGTTFNGYQYGVVRSPGDTSWYTTPSFAFSIGKSRTIYLAAKDNCGQVQVVSWTNTVIPSADANPAFSNFGCTNFDVAITGQKNLTGAQYCLFDAGGNAVSGQPCNTTSSFNIPYGSYCIKITQSCYDTVISRCFTQNKPVAAVSATTKISNYACTTFTATVTNQVNLISPTYCILDAGGNAVSGQPCNGTGIFDNLPYGQYKINVKDGCTGTVLPVSVNGVKQIRSVDDSIVINGNTCTTFNATLGGATNLNTPQYCLLDSLGHQIVCNSTGVFNNLSYGTYCIKVTDACNDTTIKRCVTTKKPTPNSGSLSASALGCGGYTVTVTGQQYIFNGQFCLLDSLGRQIACNSTGVFTNVPYGKVCVKTTDGCTAGNFSNCLTTLAPVPSVGPVVLSNQTCAGFTATITNQKNLYSPQYCLYDANNVQVGGCNATGVFSIAKYGAYTIKTKDSCTGKVLSTPFTATKPVVSVNAAVTISNQNCNTFTATVTGQANLSGGQYYLRDAAGNPYGRSSNGVFNNLSYRSYCIDIQNSCADTTVTRCFTALPPAVKATATAAPSCTLTATDMSIQVTAGTGPYQVKVYDTLFNVISSVSFSTTTTTVKNLPSLPTAQKFKVVISAACGIPDTLNVTANPSSALRTYSVTPQCPSSATANGSGNLVVTASSNLSGMSIGITQKDGSPVTIGYSFHSGNQYTFSNLDAATYVVTYTFSGCTSSINDSVPVPVYTFPNLSKSSAYQCDNNSFSVGAAVTGGIGPYTYEIIANSPSTPSLVTAPQSNPVFSVNNNTAYNLIRLRAIDACGNAALNDVSVLPLANTTVTSSADCINQSATLTTETLPNASYNWYKKSKTDSTLVSSGAPSYTIPTVHFADTGLYVAKTTVNAGCLTRLAYFRITGTCGTVLAVNIALEGKQLSNGNQLSWKTFPNSGITGFELQRNNGPNTSYISIGTIAANGASDLYTFLDNAPAMGDNLYRLHILYDGGGDNYSNVVELGKSGGLALSVYPNPVDKILNINIMGEVGQHYQLTLYNVIGQCLFTKQVDNASAPVLYQRTADVKPGFYVLKVLNTSTGTYSTFKLEFK